MSERAKLLIVDDDRLIVRMLADLFVESFEVLTASDGVQAMALVQEHSLAAVLCDQIMPGMTGVEVLAACLEKQPEAVRILVTASEEAKNVRDAINLARVHRVVSKPFREMEVDAIVKGAIREGQLERENARLVVQLQSALAEVMKRETELEHELKVRTQELKDVMGQLFTQNPA